MKDLSGKPFVIFAVFAVALLMAASAASAEMVVFLKDGSVVKVPVRRDDIIGISFEEDTAPAAERDLKAKVPGKSTGVDTCTNRLLLCQSISTTSYEKCRARAGTNAALLAQCSQDSNVAQQGCKNRFDQCIRD